ncbi:MAG TPA: tetratricopeptide repeat protein [Actinophytocola sp.]|uniref:tetratricopeptide repeat protein n=1 Tax=Actinophytocola sp. TaxID=1872138 RepID=UPI002DB5EE66|nr:tetratricopeptide repeat protein [Actinophytocola sp.]HEU5470014.1 tetratricopeptide repeat protein [Actinophytocola sp.]
MIGKWQIELPGAGHEPSEGCRAFDRGRSALVAGRLDEATVEFERAAGLRDDPLDQVGLGDVHLARGHWQQAAECYRRALTADGTNQLAQLGVSQLLVGQGRAAEAIPDLERMVAERPDEPVLRYYLASTWCSVAEQCRSQTCDEVLVITSEDQLRVCEQAARRILQLDVDDDELTRGARRLLAEVTAGRRWSWAPEGIAVSLTVLVISLGFTTVVAGGALDSVGLVIAGVLVGAALLYLIVLRFRRQAWQLRAESIARSIAKPGL